MNEIVEMYIDKVAYATGYAIDDEQNKEYLRMLMLSGLQDMKDAGVSDSVLSTNHLVFTTLIIFVTDNLNMSSGQFVTSPMYITNVSKLKWRNSDES